ncbi:MAG TPA: EAL domain-containing protein [Rhodocyclaceae bacterium]|nr:EAL domain-containing protein [Rhodocyclaceae bacterium]
MNLKTKSSLTVAVLLIVVFGIGILVQDYLIRTSLKHTIADQQFALVSRVAGEIDGRLAINLDALERVAAGLTPALVGDRPALQRFVRDQTGILAIFDALIVVSPTLQVLADVPQVAGRVGTDVSGLAHLVRLRETRQPVVSQPFLGKITGRPTVAMSVPVREPGGPLIAILSGTFDLYTPNFLGSLNAVREPGVARYVLTTRERATLVGPDSARVLAPYAKPGADPVYDRALEGWQGTAEGVTGNGERVLMSFRLLDRADWVLGALLPVDEAFVPVRESRRTVVSLLLVATLLVGVLMWFAMRRLLTPLLALRETVRRLRTDPQAAARPPTGDDEIGEVAREFYELFDQLTQSRHESFDRATQLQTVLDASPLAIAVTRERRVIRANPAYERMFGYRLEELRNRTPERHFADHEAFIAFGERMYAAVAGGGVARLEERLKDRTGRMLWADVYARLLDPSRPEEGVVVLIEDISERKASEERIRYLAEHDALTGLPNRLRLHERLAQAILTAQREHRRLALLFIDLDHFKNINDTLGHHVGDQLLRVVAERIVQCVRATDTVSRPGGDEFTLLLPDIAGPDDAARVAEKVLDALARPYSIDGRQLMISASVGIGLYPDDGADIAALMRSADLAMYHGKESGRNAYHFFRAEMNERVHERMALETALRRALKNGEFLLHYQPQIDSATRRIVGVEALLRWQDPEAGLVSPARFIPLAEETGLILPLGAWVLKEACRQNRAWQAAGLPALPVAVNISALQFRQRQFVELVADALAASGLTAACLELELTESIMMDAAERHLEVLEAIRDMGIRMAIDDFGTGYSSLAYLKRLPIDKLKIDQAFVRDVATDPDDAAIVGAIIGLARNMKLEVIAEGVESEAQLDFLRRGGCDQVQGYLFSPPLPAAAFELLWRRTLAGCRQPG